MPYIKKQHRVKYNSILGYISNIIHDHHPKTTGVPYPKGELTYLFYAIAKEYLEHHGRSYTSISTAISCLTDAAEELRRRELNPYEEIKRQENGDV